jgi:WD40 repeat protein
MEGEFTVESSDIVRLILAFLTAQGLHESARVLRKESGVGFREGGMIQKRVVAESIRQGDWGSVLKATVLLQERAEAGNDKARTVGGGYSDMIPTRIAEQVILELAEEDKNLNMAYSLLKVHRDGLDQVVESEEEDEEGDEEDNNGRNRSRVTSSKGLAKISKARSLEQRLAAIAANPTKFSDAKARQEVLYGKKYSRKSRRETLARIVERQKDIPLNRLPTLIQQAMKWQSYTGQLPWIKEVNSDAKDQEGSAGLYRDDEGSRKKKRRRLKKYDLVFGEVSGDMKVMVGDDPSLYRNRLLREDYHEAIPHDVLAKIKFGKSAVCESALFFERGLITGSSDSLIEIWDGQSSYKDLNTTDYPYQKDLVMGHTDAAILCMCISNDGEVLLSGDSNGRVKIWKLATGKCLRQYQAHDASVTTLSLSRDASRLLTGCSSGICREFGILSQNVLQVYEGHTSYIYSCQYVLEWKMEEDNNSLSATATSWVVTSSADGTVRLWQKGLSIRILQPTPYLRPPTGEKPYSIVVDPIQIQYECPAVHTVSPIPGEESRMLVVSRSSVAYLVNVEGNVLQEYKGETDDSIFVAATVTPTLAYIATAKGDCLVFSVSTGKLIHTIREFALDSTSKTNTDHRLAEIASLTHHPSKPSILAAFSNDKTQKKGVLTVWK